MNAHASTGAATTGGHQAVTLEGIQRALAEVDRLGPPPRREPLRLTRAELDRVARELKVPAEGHTTIFGVPVIVIADDHPLAVMGMVDRDKFVLKHASGWTQWLVKP